MSVPPLQKSRSSTRRPNHSYTLTTAATTQISLQSVLFAIRQAAEKFPDTKARIILTGSGAKPVAEAADTPYIQEVVANSIALKKTYETVGTAIELGGQDAKIIFFKDEFKNRRVKRRRHAHERKLCRRNRRLHRRSRFHSPDPAGNNERTCLQGNLRLRYLPGAAASTQKPISSRS